MKIHSYLVHGIRLLMYGDINNNLTKNEYKNSLITFLIKKNIYISNKYIVL